MPTNKETKSMTADHYAKIQKGRAEGLAVRKYLEAVTGKPSSNRRDISGQLERIKEELAIVTSPLDRLKLLKKQYNLENNIGTQVIDLAEAEREFIQVLPSYSEREGIPREVWLDAGVPESVLDKAGL